MEVIFNLFSLTYKEIERLVTRIKIFIINDFNQLLMCKSVRIYYFVGGHVEDTETLTETLKIEGLEETGIDFEVDDNNETFNLDCRRLDVTESKKDFSLEYVNLEEVEGKLLGDVSTPDQEALAKEMIDVISRFKTKPKTIKKELRGGCNE